MENKINVLSLFDGIGGFRQALKELNIDCNYYACEIDKYAIKVAKENHPDIIQIGDVKGIIIENYYIFYNQYNYPMKNGGSFRKDINLMCFGFPCQSFSVAGNKNGFSDDRGQLFFDALRILKEVKPKFFIAENVASMKKSIQQEISKYLFGIEPTLINSSLLTAQQRKRLYWVGKLQNNGSYKKVEIDQPEDKKILLKDILESGVEYLDKCQTLTASYGGAEIENSLQKNQRTMIAEPIRLGHFNKGGQGNRVYSVNGKSICLSANGGGGGACTKLYKINLPDGDYKIRLLTPTECARLQGFPDDYCESVSKTQAFKCYGNSFTVPVIKYILEYIFFDKKCKTNKQELLF